MKLLCKNILQAVMSNYFTTVQPVYNTKFQYYTIKWIYQIFNYFS